MPAWINGPASYASGLDRFGNIVADMVGANVGYYGDPSQSDPGVGETYTAHLVVGVGFPPRGGVVMNTSILLPSSTTLLLTQPGIRCFRQNRTTGAYFDSTNDPSANCPRNPATLPNGEIDLGQRDLPQNNLFEIQFDLVTSAPGQGTLQGIVQSQYGTVPCSVGVQIFPRLTLKARGSQIYPRRGVWDSQVRLFGDNLNVGGASVQFGPDDLPRSPVKETATEVVATVPAGTGSGPLEGPVQIILTNDLGSIVTDDTFFVIPT